MNWLGNYAGKLTRSSLVGVGGSSVGLGVLSIFFEKIDIFSCSVSSGFFMGFLGYLFLDFDRFLGSLFPFIIEFMRSDLTKSIFACDGIWKVKVVLP